jgi:hypothetical protein
MTFTPEQINHEANWRQTANPGQDSQGWKVDLGDGRQPGWLYAARSLPPPSDEWVADKLNRLERQARGVGPRGRHAGRGRDEARGPSPRERIAERSRVRPLTQRS